MYILCLFFLLACDEKDNEAKPEDRFSKIIDSKTYDDEFYPWDIKETEDKGFVMLSSSNNSALKNIHILKTDNKGEFQWELKDSSSFKNPLPVLFQKNGEIYLFAMHQVTLTTHLLKIDMETKTLVEVQVYADFLYPIAANEVPGGYLVECFDRDAQRIRLMKLDGNFNESWRERYDVYEDPVEFNEHLLRSNPLPFFCGHVGTNTSASSYFIGGMYNFTLTTLFVNPNDGELKKRITGFRYEAGVSALLHTEASNFFLIKHNLVGENTVLPSFSVEVTDGTTLNSQNDEDVPEQIDLELPNRVKTVLKKLEIDGKERVVQLTETKNQEVLINVYTMAGDLIFTKKIGLETPHFIGNITTTSDGSLILFTKTLISSRISKLSLTKFSI